MTHHNELKGFVLWNTYEREKIKQCLDDEFKGRLRVVALSSKLELQAITIMAQMLIEAAELSVEVSGHGEPRTDSRCTHRDAPHGCHVVLHPTTGTRPALVCTQHLSYHTRRL